MISLLIYVLILILVFGAIVYLLRTLPIAEPFRSICYVILFIVALLVLLSFLGVVPGPWPRVTL